MAVVEVRTHRYPPFPSPPAGVPIISFANFTGFGPRIVRDGEDFERDGLGIRTKVLAQRTKSAGGAGLTMLGKGVKNTKQATAKAATPWHEQWAYADPRHQNPFDSSMSLAARLVGATEEFDLLYGINKLQATLPDVYQVFRILKIFVGARDPREGPKLGKGLAPAEADVEEGMSEEDDFEGGGNLVPPSIATMTNTTTPVRVDGEAAALAECTDAAVDPMIVKAEKFADQPEYGVQVFLSSYFYDQDFIRKAKRVVAAPHVLRFYLRFLARTEVIAQSELQKALAVVDRAAIDLPGAAILSTALPDKLSKAFVSTWDRVDVYVLDLGLRSDGAQVDMPGSEINREGTDVDDGQDRGRHTERIHAQRILVGGAADVDIETKAKAEGGWGSGCVTEDADGWGKQPGRWGVDPTHGGWGDDAADTKASSTTGCVSQPSPTFESLLGMPITADEIKKALCPGFAERSMRRLTGVSLPTAEAALPLATLVFSPWPNWNAPTDLSHDAPHVVRSSTTPHDIEKDEITVLTSLETGEAAKPYVGMGVWGTWVRLEGVDGEAVDERAAGMEGKWYMENVTLVIPSYWVNG